MRMSLIGISIFLKVDVDFSVPVDRVHSVSLCNLRYFIYKIRIQVGDVAPLVGSACLACAKPWLGSVLTIT